MKRWPQIAAALVLALAASRGSASAQSPHLLVIVGLAGDPEFAEPYGKWGAALVDAATTRFGIPQEQVTYLHETPETDATRPENRLRLVLTPANTARPRKRQK